MSKLTDRGVLTDPDVDSVLHIVDVTDLTDSPEGTSKQIKLSEVRNLKVSRLLEAVSLAPEQQPTARGKDNALTVEFGVAQFGLSDPVMIDVDGKATFNEGGLHRVSLFFQVGRTGSSQTSLVFIRLLINGVQLAGARSIGYELSTSDDLYYSEITNWFNVPAGTTLEVQIMRDLGGNDSGGLFRKNPTDEGAGTWNNSPCADMRIERLV